MAIKSFNLITIEEFKTWSSFDTNLNETSAYADNYIMEAIETTSNLFNAISGDELSQKWDLLNEAVEADEKKIGKVKFAVAKQVQFLLRKGVEYLRETSTSTSAGGLSFSTSNPEDPLYVVPEAIPALKFAGFYIDFNALNLDNRPKRKLDLGITTFDKDGEYDPYTRKEADAKFMWKDGTLVSLTETISIEKMRNYENRGQWTLDIKGKALENISKATTPIVKESLKQDQEFLNDLEAKLEPPLEATLIEKLPKNKEFVEAIISQAPPLSSDAFNKLLVADKDYVALLAVIQDLTARIVALEAKDFNTQFKDAYENLDLDTTKK